MSEAKELAAKIADMIRENTDSIPVGLAALSLSLVTACAVIGIPKKALKQKMEDDIDTIYDLHEEYENEEGH